MKATLGLVNLFLPGIGSAIGAGSSAAGALGRASGGPVDPHRYARGYTDGGIPSAPHVAAARPAGLDPHDTVPIWADPREWVIRASAVAKYGHGIMDAINRGLVDPMGLSALAGVRRGSQTASRGRRSGMGFATGGSIATATGGGSSPSSDRQQSGPVPAFIVANEQNLERMLAGGENAVLDFMGRFRSDIRRKLAI